MTAPAPQACAASPSAPDGEPLLVHMRADLNRPAPGGLEPLLEELHRRHGDALRAIVLYGSTRRTANPRDGLVDLMAIVRDYRAVHGFSAAALFNRLLPPNVYYLEAGPDEARLRCKYIIVSIEHLRRRTGGGLDGYFWARFTQPCRLVWSADDDAKHRVTECRARAALRFASEAATLGDGEFDARAFWHRALRASYGCELRPEPPGAAEKLVAHDPEFWDGLGRLCAERVESMTCTSDAEPPRLRVQVARGAGFRGRMRWRARRVWSRTLNVLRLFKAAGTFANGVDYLSWKLERHSGIRVEPTERMRRHPRLAAWGLLFKLIRTGALR